MRACGACSVTRQPLLSSAGLIGRTDSRLTPAGTPRVQVQKVRKTVNEYYMCAAGLPDPTLLEGSKERALAIAALACSMVQLMDIINIELKQLNVRLQARVASLSPPTSRRPRERGTPPFFCVHLSGCALARMREREPKSLVDPPPTNASHGLSCFLVFDLQIGSI